jgi:hypothetical protein
MYIEGMVLSRKQIPIHNDLHVGKKPIWKQIGLYLGKNGLGEAGLLAGLSGSAQAARLVRRILGNC